MSKSFRCWKWRLFKNAGSAEMSGTTFVQYIGPYEAVTREGFALKQGMQNILIRRCGHDDRSQDNGQLKKISNSGPFELRR